MSAYQMMLAGRPPAAPAIITETWTGTNGDPWPSMWEFASDATTPVKDIQGNTGRLGHLAQGSYRANSATIKAATFDVADAEILVKMKPDKGGYSTVRLRFDADGAGSSYEVERDANGAGTWYVQATKYPGPTWTSLGSITGTVGSFSQWHWIRFRVQGTAVKAKVWVDGTSEPGSWNVDTTSTILSGSGQVRLSVGGRSTSVDYYSEFDDLTVEAL